MQVDRNVSPLCLCPARLIGCQGQIKCRIDATFQQPPVSLARQGLRWGHGNLDQPMPIESVSRLQHLTYEYRALHCRRSPVGTHRVNDVSTTLSTSFCRASRIERFVRPASDTMPFQLGADAVPTCYTMEHLTCLVRSVPGNDVSKAYLFLAIGPLYGTAFVW